MRCDIIVSGSYIDEIGGLKVFYIERPKQRLRVQAVQLREAIECYACKGDWLVVDGDKQYFLSDEEFAEKFIEEGFIYPSSVEGGHMGVGCVGQMQKLSCNDIPNKWSMYR